MTFTTLLADLSEQRLLQRFTDLVRQHRHDTAQLLAHIAEIDERKLWAKHACTSMFAFCMERFHMSESMTAKRIWAARTARRFPVILPMVARGELHLSAINQLGKHLTENNHQSLLQRAKHKSSREIDLLLAELAPRPDVPSRVRALPRPNCLPAAAGAAKPAAAHRQIVALAPRRFKIEITVDQNTHDQLRSLQDLLSHQLPSADPAMIVSRAIELLFVDTLKKKAAVVARSSMNRDGAAEQRAVLSTITRSRTAKAAVTRWRISRYVAGPIISTRQTWTSDESSC